MTCGAWSISATEPSSQTSAASSSPPWAHAVGRGVTALPWWDERREGLVQPASYSKCLHEHRPLGVPVGEPNVASFARFLAGHPVWRSILASVSLFPAYAALCPYARSHLATLLTSHWGPRGPWDPTQCSHTDAHPRDDPHPAFRGFTTSHQSSTGRANSLHPRPGPRCPPSSSRSVGNAPHREPFTLGPPTVHPAAL